MTQYQRHQFAENTPQEEQLARRIASAAIDTLPVDAEMAIAVGNLIIGNAAVAAASLNNAPVVSSRDQAIAHPHHPGAILFGLSPYRRYSPEWVAWTNGLAVCGDELHGASHQGGSIPPILAATQHWGLTGADLVRGVAVAWEIQVGLVKSLDGQGAHLAPGAIAGIGAALGLGRMVIQRAARLVIPTPSRDAASSGHAQALAGKMSVEAVDWALRGEGEAPSALEDGNNGISILPEKDERRRAVLESVFFTRNQCVEKFRALADGIISVPEQDRFLRAVDRLPDLKAEELGGLGFTVDPDILQRGGTGLFDRKR